MTRMQSIISHTGKLKSLYYLFIVVSTNLFKFNNCTFDKTVQFVVQSFHYTVSKILFNLFQKPLDVTNHSIAREVVTFFTLPPGDYIVVPQTNVPNCDGKFLLRILTDEQSNIW